MKNHTFSCFFSLAILLIGFIAFIVPASAQNQIKLNGTIISDSSASGDNPAIYAFDGDENSYYKSNQSSHAWVGLDLGTQHVITSFRWINKAGTYEMTYYLPWFYKRVNMPYCYQAVVEGANSPDFCDAIPIYMIISESEVATWQEAKIETTRGFRYVRYVGPNSSYGQICDIEFYGVEGSGNDSKLFQITNLPTVSVHVTNGEDPVNKTDELLAYSSVVSHSGSKIIEDTCTFRLRGNSSMEFEKKPYRLKFSNKQKMPGCDYKAKKWTLIPNLDDKSLMRNVIGFEVNKSVGLEYTPYCHSVDLIVNGEFKGNYQLCDQVEANKNRIDIEEIDPAVHTAASQFGWFIEIDKLADREPDGSWFNSVNGIPVTIKSPDSKEINQDFLCDIKTHFDNMEKCVYEGRIDSVYGYRHYLDMESFERYFIASEFLVNSDAYHSIFLHKHIDDDKFYVGPIWDLNLTLNNDYRFPDVNKRTRWSYFESSADAGTIRTFLLKMMEYDPAVLQEVKNFWATIRQTKAITTERLISVVDSMAMLLQESQYLNFKRWDVLNDKLFFSVNSYGSYQGEVDAIKNVLSGRIDWMDNMLSCTLKDIEIIIPEEGWTTLYLPMAFDVPDDIHCYTITGIEGSTLVLKEERLMQANRPYLVQGRPGSYVISGYQVDACDYGRNGLMVGACDTRNIPVGAFALQIKNGVAIFAKVEDENTVEIKSGYSYIELPKEGFSEQKCLFLPTEGIEGIITMAMENFNGISIYSLDGKLLYSNPNNRILPKSIITQLGHGSFIVKSAIQQGIFAF